MRLPAKICGLTAGLTLAIEAVARDNAIPIVGTDDSPIVVGGVMFSAQLTSPELKDEARARLDGLDALLARADNKTSAAWLLKLMVRTSGAKLSRQDAETAVAAYISALDYPAFCYTDEIGKEAALEFKFFPSLKELSDLLDQEVNPMRRLRRHLESIVNAKEQPLAITDQRAPATPEQVDKILRTHGYEPKIKNEHKKAETVHKSPKSALSDVQKKMDGMTPDERGKFLRAEMGLPEKAPAPEPEPEREPAVE